MYNHSVFDDCLPSLPGTWELPALRVDDSNHERKVLLEAGFGFAARGSEYTDQLERLHDTLWGVDDAHTFH